MLVNFVNINYMYCLLIFGLSFEGQICYPNSSNIIVQYFSFTGRTRAQNYELKVYNIRLVQNDFCTEELTIRLNKLECTCIT